MANAKTKTPVTSTPAKKRTRRFFSYLDKQQIVGRIKGGETYDAVSKELSIHPNLLRAWVSKMGTEATEVPSVPGGEGMDYIRRLEAKVKNLEDQVDFYTRAARMFAAQSSKSKREGLQNVG